MIEEGIKVEHSEFGIGKVLAVLGNIATVDFFGEVLDVGMEELLPSRHTASLPVRKGGGKEVTDTSFRKIFEAVNLGVVPNDPARLVDLTIGGEKMSKDIASLLSNASKEGVCRIFIGYYGSGKSHHLQVVRSVALRDGWVTASLELDPKAADPAKPSTVYQALVSGLAFPMRADGSKSSDFFDLVKEIRDNWTKVRDLPYFRKSPWFKQGMEALLHLSHRRDDTEYVAAVNWLAGEIKQISVIRSVSWRAGYRSKVPSLPQSKDTGLVYAFNLIVLDEVVKALGYKGLAIIIDEAEHVRSYSFNRYMRANNFFDLLARCAHKPRKHLERPSSDYEIPDLPQFWSEGPHFALFVGLTEGEDTRDLNRKVGDMSVLIHDPGDVVHLVPPSEYEYEKWVSDFLNQCVDRLGPKVNLLSDVAIRAQIAATLRQYFEKTPLHERVLRNWTKLAGLAPSILLSREDAVGAGELLEMIAYAAGQVAEEMMPWDE